MTSCVLHSFKCTFRVQQTHDAESLLHGWCCLEVRCCIYFVLGVLRLLSLLLHHFASLVCWFLFFSAAWTFGCGRVLERSLSSAPSFLHRSSEHFKSSTANILGAEQFGLIEIVRQALYRCSATAGDQLCGSPSAAYKLFTARGARPSNVWWTCRFVCAPCSCRLDSPLGGGLLQCLAPNRRNHASSFGLTVFRASCHRQDSGSSLGPASPRKEHIGLHMVIHFCRKVRKKNYGDRVAASINLCSDVI